MTRRTFLSSATASVLAAREVLGAQTSHSKKRDRLACNSWPFRGYFDTPEMHEYRNPSDPLLTQAEFPVFLADQFGIHNVEFLPQHFSDTETSTLEKIKSGLTKAHSRCCNLMGVEVPGGVYRKNADRQAIAKAVERWVTVASSLGSPSITIALTGEGSVDAHTAFLNLESAVEIAHRRGIKVLFHNDDLQHESAEILTELVKQFGRTRVGTCPDFGNFATRSPAFALAQLRLLAPYASEICHSKDGIASKGSFFPDDFAASMKVMRDAGFEGLYSLEFEGLGQAVDGVRKLMNLTEANLHG